jgi:hypothetical protein
VVPLITPAGFDIAILTVYILLCEYRRDHVATLQLSRLQMLLHKLSLLLCTDYWHKIKIYKNAQTRQFQADVNKIHVFG